MKLFGTESLSIKMAAYQLNPFPDKHTMSSLPALGIGAVPLKEASRQTSLSCAVQEVAWSRSCYQLANAT